MFQKELYKFAGVFALTKYYLIIMIIDIDSIEGQQSSHPGKSDTNLSEDYI